MAANSSIPNICVWGQASSGKTVLLGSALTMLAERVNAPTSDAHYYVEPGDDAGRRFKEDTLSALKMGKLPGPNPLDEFEPFSLRIELHDYRSSGRYGRIHRLRLADATGEHMRHRIDLAALDYPDQIIDPGDRYWLQMRQAHGILFVVDIDRPNRETYVELVDRFVENMAGKFDDKYLAICITKADIRFHERQEALNVAGNQDKLIALLNEAMGGMHYGTLAARFPKRSLIFLTSAAGWYDNNGVWQPNISSGQLNMRPNLIDTSHWQSFQVVHALLWLFDRLEESRIRRAQANPLLKRLALQNRVPNLALLKRQYGSEVEYP